MHSLLSAAKCALDARTCVAVVELAFGPTTVQVPQLLAGALGFFVAACGGVDKVGASARGQEVGWLSLASVRGLVSVRGVVPLQGSV
jgi:hypothetical protein